MPPVPWRVGQEGGPQRGGGRWASADQALCITQIQVPDPPAGRGPRGLAQATPSAAQASWLRALTADPHMTVSFGNSCLFFLL